MLVLETSQCNMHRMLDECRVVGFVFSSCSQQEDSIGILVVNQESDRGSLSTVSEKRGGGGLYSHVSEECPSRLLRIHVGDGFSNCVM